MQIISGNAIIVSINDAKIQFEPGMNNVVNDLLNDIYDVLWSILGKKSRPI